MTTGPPEKYEPQTLEPAITAKRLAPKAFEHAAHVPDDVDAVRADCVRRREVDVAETLRLRRQLRELGACFLHGCTLHIREFAGEAQGPSLTGHLCGETMYPCRGSSSYGSAS